MPGGAPAAHRDSDVHGAAPPTSSTNDTPRVDGTDTGGTADSSTDPGSGRDLASLRDRPAIHDGFRVHATIPTPPP
ncbi:hypothetical protein [Dactylosporangium sp. NPDC000521]|uniref:hypothetical protein n=1 Tax=Dactylosporangium sp. NPDC000521 TaxID=3363975 RepID=UPI00368811CB